MAINDPAPAQTTTIKIHAPLQQFEPVSAAITTRAAGPLAVSAPSFTTAIFDVQPGSIFSG